MRDWRRWSGSPVPAKQIYMLRKFEAPEELGEGTRAFARVYEYTQGPGLDLVTTTGVIRFIHTESGGLFAEETTSEDYDFINAHENEGWKFQALDLTDPGLIEKITNAFKAFKGYGCEWDYELYERATQVAIVRSPNPDFIPKQQAAAIAMIAPYRCWDGQPHHFDDPNIPSPILMLPEIDGKHPYQVCSKCGAPIRQ